MVPLKPTHVFNKLEGEMFIFELFDGLLGATWLIFQLFFCSFSLVLLFTIKLFAPNFLWRLAFLGMEF